MRRSNQLSYKAMLPHLFVFPADRNIPAKNRYDFYSLILYAPPRTYRNGANSGNRTRTFCLEGRCSTIKLYRQKRSAAWKREKIQCHFEKIGQIGKECYANRKKSQKKKGCVVMQVHDAVRHKTNSMRPFWLGWNDLNVRESAVVKTLCLYHLATPQ